MEKLACAQPTQRPQLAAAALALAHTDEALRELRATVDRVSHQQSSLRKLLRTVEVRLGIATRALERAQGAP